MPNPKVLGYFCSLIFVLPFGQNLGREVWLNTFQKFLDSFEVIWGTFEVVLDITEGRGEGVEAIPKVLG